MAKNKGVRESQRQMLNGGNVGGGDGGGPPLTAMNVQRNNVLVYKISYQLAQK